MYNVKAFIKEAKSRGASDTMILAVILDKAGMKKESNYMRKQAEIKEAGLLSFLLNSAISGGVGFGLGMDYQDNKMTEKLDELTKQKLRDGTFSLEAEKKIRESKDKAGTIGAGIGATAGLITAPGLLPDANKPLAMTLGVLGGGLAGNIIGRTISGI